MSKELTEFELMVATQLKQLDRHRDTTEAAARQTIVGQQRWGQWESLAEISADTILQLSAEAGGTMVDMVLWADENGYKGILVDVATTLATGVRPIATAKSTEIGEVTGSVPLVKTPEAALPEFQINDGYLAKAFQLSTTASSLAQQGRLYESLNCFRTSLTYLFLAKVPTNIEKRKTWAVETITEVDLILAGLIAPCFQRARAAGKQLILVTGKS
jgi:hypothetical protein